MASSGMSARAWTLFAAVSVLWGIPYLFIKLAVEDLSPVMVAWGRLAVAFAVLLPYAIHKGALRNLGARWKVLLGYSIVELILPWPLIGFGEQRVSSGLAAILIAAVPLVVALMALRVDPDERAEGARLAGLMIGFAGVVVLLGLDVAGRPGELLGALMALRVDPDERAEGARLAGLMIGFAGVVVLLGLDVAGRPGELLGALAILLAAVGYAAGPMIIKHRLGDLDPLGPVTASMGISALVLTPPAFASAPSSLPAGDTIVSILVLGLACSAFAFLLFFALINEVGPGRATVITYVNPVVAVGLGVTLLGERVGPTAVAGLLLILAGSWLSTGGRLPPGLMQRITPARRRGDAADASGTVRATA